MFRLSKVLASGVSALTVAAGLLLLGPPTSAEAVPTTIPLTIKNNSGRGEQVYIYNIGTLLSTGQQGWADANGTFHAWPAGGNPADPRARRVDRRTGQRPDQDDPDAQVLRPGLLLLRPEARLQADHRRTGAARRAEPVRPERATSCSTGPSTRSTTPACGSTAPRSTCSRPRTRSASRRADGTVKNTGHLKPGGYNGFFNALSGQPGGWANLIQDPLRRHRRCVPSRPATASRQAPCPATVMNDYINRVWSKYASSTLTVTPFANQPDTKYYGRVSGNVMNFTNGSGAVVTSFQKPDSDSIFGCYKLLDAPNDLVRGPISRTLCAGFNRSTLLTNPNQPDASRRRFYQDAVTNHYSRKIHAQMADGKAYGFAFDDVGAHESLVHDGNPQKAYMTLDPYN